MFEPHEGNEIDFPCPWFLLVCRACAEMIVVDADGGRGFAFGLVISCLVLWGFGEA